MMRKMTFAGLLVGVLGLSACSNSAKLEAQAAKAEQQKAQQIESTERAAREAQRRLDQQ